MNMIQFFSYSFHCFQRRNSNFQIKRSHFQSQIHYWRFKKFCSFEHWNKKLGQFLNDKSFKILLFDGNLHGDKFNKETVSDVIIFLLRE